MKVVLTNQHLDSKKKGLEKNQELRSWRIRVNGLLLKYTPVANQIHYTPA